MHTDAKTLENGTVIQGDLCIVGAGAAGISIAREWENSPLKVVLLEGGGFDFEPEIQDLYRGEIVGATVLPAAGGEASLFRWDYRPLGRVLLDL
jgi:choline dehydrogenase-like flavoprotein